MSSGLPPVGGASFFPTAKELSSGVQWFRDHPVLACAAATAVSVITYLNTVENGEEAAVAAGADPDPSQEGRTEEQQAPRRPLKSAVRSPLSTSAIGSDGRLSAAVSWCDEHGGSLTQVFGLNDDEEDEEDELDLDRPLELFRTARPRRGTATATGTPSSPRRKRAASEDSTSEDGSDADDRAALLKAQATEQTESPQWGWYVPITPPQDEFHAALPRAVSVSPATRAVSVGSAMRRSTSGRLP